MMPRYVTTKDQHWEEARLGGYNVQECALWQSGHEVYAGLFRLPQGFVFPRHRHGRWVQIFVLEGALRVDADGFAPATIHAGEYYFVEPGEAHVETALEDTKVFVVTAEDRNALRESFGPL